jgi:hypothetical protein
MLEILSYILRAIGYFKSSLTGSSHSSKVGIILGAVGGLIGLLIVVVLFLFCKGRKKRHLREVFVDVPGNVSMTSFSCMILIGTHSSLSC